MTGIEILEYIRPEVLILIPVLMILGLMIKKIPNIKDWTIPIILVVIGVMLSISIIGLQDGFTAANIVNALIQGILVAGMAVYVHQMIIQSTRKREQGSIK